MLEGEKNNLQANTRKKKFIVNQGVEKKFHDQTKSPTPPPQKSNGRPLKLPNYPCERPIVPLLSAE